MKRKSLPFLLLFLFSFWGSIFAQSTQSVQEKREAQYTCVDVHKYEHTMWLTCQLFEGDQPIEDFEIAVFSREGECRAQSLSGGDPNFRNIAYVTIHGTAGVDSAMTVRVVYGDEHDRYKYNVEVEGLTFNMMSDESYGSTMEPFPVVLPGKACFSWSVGAGPEHKGTAAQLTPGLLEGATRLTLRGSWTEEECQQLQEQFPSATLQEVRLSSEWAQRDFGSLLSGCNALTALRLNAVPRATSSDFLSTVNPNCLIYFPQGTASPAPGWSNVVAEGDSAYTALTNLHFVGSTPDRPCPFALDKDIALNGHRATYTPATLNFANGKGGGWNTLVLPFDADVYADGTRLSGNFDEYPAPDSYWLMRYRRVQDASLVLTYVETGLTAHVPYLLSLPGDSLSPDNSLEHSDITFRSSGTTIRAVPAKIQDPSFADRPQQVELLGNYQLQTAASRYLLGTLDDGSNAFVYRTTARLLPFECYMRCADNAPDAPQAFTISNRYLPTGIEDILMDQPGQKEVYDLSGRRIENNIPLRSGIYIVNGKKILIND